MAHSAASEPVVSMKTFASGGGRRLVIFVTSFARISVGKQ
jgi:hypothetical protein